MVYSWLGYTNFDFIDLSKTKTCCAYDESQNIKPDNSEYDPANYMFDGNPSTIWHSNGENIRKDIQVQISTMENIIFM